MGEVWSEFFGTLWRNAWVRRLVFAALAAEVFVVVLLPAYTAGFEWLKAKGEADAAVLKFASAAKVALEKARSETAAANHAAELTASAAKEKAALAEGALSNAKTELQVAENSIARQRGETEGLEAEVSKIISEGEISRQAALNAAQKSRADAIALKYESSVRRAKGMTMAETARNAQRAQRAASDKAEADVKSMRYALDLMMATYFGGCRGRDFETRISAAEAGRC